MRATLKLEFPSDPRFLALLRAVIGGVAEIVGFSEKEVCELKLAINEAVTNIIRHSLKNHFDRIIEIDLLLEERGLEVVLSDDGEPAEDPNLQPLEPSLDHPGRVGLYLIHQCMDKVLYERLSNNRNQLCLVKYLK